MSRFTGKQGKGAMRTHREFLRAEAIERQKAVKHDRTKAHRLERCECK